LQRYNSHRNIWWINIGVTSTKLGYETKYSIQRSTGTWVEHVSFNNHNFNISYNTLLYSSYNLKRYRYVHWIIHFFRRGGSMKVSTIKIQNRSQIIFLGFLFTSTGQ
jgi:hypothetical protein